MIHNAQIPALATPPDLDPTIHNLMELLTAVILADGHIFPSEVEALIRSADHLKLENQLGYPLTGLEIKVWFEAYKMRMNAETDPVRPEIALTQLILKLSDWPDKQAVIDVLTEISLADANFHLKEKTLISIVRAFWQFEGLDASGARIIG
jgi:uncharacterized tellurite resistance protein B-like protein